MNPNLQQSLMSSLGYPGNNIIPSQPKGIGPVANASAYSQMLMGQKAQSSVYDQRIAAAEAEAKSAAEEYRRIQSQLSAQPKIYSYNVADASAKARANAANAVNPYYTQQLNKFLQQQDIQRQRSQQDASSANVDIDQALQDALQQTGIQRQRTEEDATTKLGDVAAASDYYQNTESNAFDKARSSLLANLAQSGLTTSGLGAQQSNEQIANRNVESAVQSRSFNAQTNAINTLKTRTFEDLARSDTQGTRNAGQSKAKVQVNLDRALQDIDIATDQGKAKNEYERLGALSQEEQRQYQLGVNQFIQALAGKGVRAQDIQATRSAYGI